MSSSNATGLQQSATMTGHSLLDAAAGLFVLYRVGRANSRSLGESLHALIALLLLVALFLGFRMAREVRALLGEAADMLQAIPGLGSKVLVIVGAWFLMRLLRTRSGNWMEKTVPRRLHRRLTPLSEGLRALLLVGFLAWLTSGLFSGPPRSAPLLVQGVRLGEAWVLPFLQQTPSQRSIRLN
jgi:hypothetical protein